MEEEREEYDLYPFYYCNKKNDRDKSEVQSRWLCNNNLTGGKTESTLIWIPRMKMNEVYRPTGVRL